MSQKIQKMMAELQKDLIRTRAMLRNHFGADDVADLDLHAGGSADLCAQVEDAQRAAGGYVAASLSMNGMSAQLKRVMRLLPPGATCDEAAMSELLNLAGITDVTERLGCKIEASAIGILRK